MKLKGKIINFLGDSITEGARVADIKRNRYDNALKEKAKLKAVHNYGISGTRLAHQMTPSGEPRMDLCFCGRAYDLDTSADIIVVYGGVNDFLHGDAPLGNPGDRTPATFRGAVWFLMNLLKTRYEGKTVVFMTPARCFYCGISMYSPSPDAHKGENAGPLLEYVNIIVETGKELGVPVLNLYNELGIDPNLPEDKEKYTADGLHFNDLGHHVLAAKLKEFLETL